MKSAGKLLLPASLAVLFTFALASCTTLNEGTVVAKRFRPVNPEFQSLGDTYTVEIAGTTAKGKSTRRTVLVSEDEWSRLEVGDHFSVAERKPTGPSVVKTLTSGHRRKSQRTTEEVSTPAPKNEGMLSRITGLFKSQPQEKSATPREKTRTATKKKHSTAAQPTNKEKPATKPDSTPKPTASATPATKPSAAPSTSPAAATSPRKDLSYDEAAARAAEDPRVRQLKQKIHAAQSDEDQHKAANDYFKAYYGRMRELAPAAKDRIDKEEASKLR